MTALVRPWGAGDRRGPHGGQTTCWLCLKVPVPHPRTDPGHVGLCDGCDEFLRSEEDLSR